MQLRAQVKACATGTCMYVSQRSAGPRVGHDGGQILACHCDPPHLAADLCTAWPVLESGEQPPLSS